MPPSSAQEVADKLCFAGVRGLWNFANVDLEVPDHVSVENVHLSDSLYSLAYRMNEQGPRLRPEAANRDGNPKRRLEAASRVGNKMKR